MDTETIGIDLAAQPPGTAVATLRWSGGQASLRRVDVGVTDSAIIEALRAGAQKVAIDCPLGWPTPFVELVLGHQQDELPGDLAQSEDWPRSYTNRATDLHVRAAVKMIPLSVAADRIGHTALRCAALLAQARLRGVDVSRDGSGDIAEVYPAAALKVWGLPFRRYKGTANATAREALVDGLVAAAPWLDLGPHEAVVKASDHALDSVVCALVARAVAIGGTAPPDTRAAAKEGWIHYPTVPLTELGARG